jgi:uncharacterized protein
MTSAPSQATRFAASPRDVFERVRRSVMEYDANGFADLFASDGMMEFPFGGGAVGLPACLEGREQIRRHMSSALTRSWESGRRFLGYDDLVVHETSDPEVIIVEFDLHGQTPAGQTYQLPYVQVFRVRDGEILSMRDYFSSERLAAVLSAT